ncbi:MAG: ATP-dependent DNA ligase [Actinobacteria bacterium]|nr:ATP-dependent DNA ligase [Actinomycetota bacterium]
MDFSILADAYQRIEKTSKRIEMTKYLVDLVKSTPARDLPKIVYLTQGKLYPDFAGIEIGMAEKMAVKSVSIATGLTDEEINRDLRKTGDLGLTASLELERAAPERKKPLTVDRVYKVLDEVAHTAGPGSAEKKVKLLASLLSNATPTEAKYIVRIVTGKLRLGVADMTMLDALALTYGEGPEARPLIERAYNITSDLGEVASALATKGVSKIRDFHIELGKPIRPMLAERVHAPEEAAEKLGAEFVAEYKYDGERVQVHKNGKRIMLFSRRLENITGQFPDVVALARNSIAATAAILEAEIVAMNPATGDMRPFQELMRRRRKYGVAEAAKELPASVFFFDCLYAEGRDYTGEPYPERREALARSLRIGDAVNLAQNKIVRGTDELESFFEKAVEEGCEGVVAKSTGSESIYRAGARGWLWIKYKREYRSEMTDTADLVVVGGYYGRGRRAGVYGSLLMACYDDKTDTFKSVTKLGAGLTDKDLAELPGRLSPYVLEHVSPRVDAKERPDVWFEPSLVLEIIGAEITLSPIHTCGYNRFREGSGLAIRFPRFTGRYREDKAPEDATTEEEIIEMYESRLRKVAA